MEESGTNLLEYLMKDFSKDEQKTMSEDIKEAYGELGTKFDKDDLEILYSCYEAERSDSLNSMAMLVAIASFKLAFLAFLVQIITSIFNEIYLNWRNAGILVVSAIFLFVIRDTLCKIVKLSEESARLRNRQVALKLYQANRKATGGDKKNNGK